MLLATYFNRGDSGKADKELDWLRKNAQVKSDLEPIGKFLGYWRNHPAKAQKFNVPPGTCAISLCPIANRLLVTTGEASGKNGYYLLDLDKGTTKQIGRYDAGGCPPLWTPDGGTILLNTATEVLVISADSLKIRNRWNQDYLFAWAFSPDGRKLALSDKKGLWISDSSGQGKTLYWKSPGKNKVPKISAWAPDNSRLLFYYVLWEGSRGLFQADLNTRKLTVVTDESDIVSAGYTPDGESVYWSTVPYGEEEGSIKLKAIADSQPPRDIWPGVSLTGLVWDPGGRVLYHMSNASQVEWGADILWKMEFPEKDRVIPISHVLGDIIAWEISDNDKYAYYLFKPVDGVEAQLWGCEIH
jgi:hypothetical protein